MEEFEQKEAWVLDKHDADISHGTLILKDGKPLTLIDGGIVYKIRKHNAVYYSEDEANSAKQEYVQQIKSLCKETKRNIEKLDELSNSLAARKDYIPEDILNSSKNYDECYDVRELLTTYIQYGMININAVSFTKDSVSHVNWGETAAEIVLKNGQKIRTYDHIEFEFISRIFGCCYRDRCFTAIKPEKEEEEDG